MLILSLFDFTGNWSKPWRDAGYDVLQIDIQHGQDILTWDYTKIDKKEVYGILASVPCTDFALSGARHFDRKDKDGTTQKSIDLVKKTVEIINFFNPKFWVIENPMSRIHKLNPELGDIKFKFNPCDFAGYCLDECEQLENRYNKMTWLWGNFIIPEKKYLEPLHKEFPGWSKFGGKSLKTKNARSITPMRFFLFILSG